MGGSGDMPRALSSGRLVWTVRMGVIGRWVAGGQGKEVGCQEVLVQTQDIDEGGAQGALGRGSRVGRLACLRAYDLL